jgi:hypothetical protein
MEVSTMKMFEIYLTDLKEDKQEEFIDMFGEDGNYDTFPIATVEIEEEDDFCPQGGDITDDCKDCEYSADFHYFLGQCISRDLDLNFKVRITNSDEVIEECTLFKDFIELNGGIDECGEVIIDTLDLISGDVNIAYHNSFSSGLWEFERIK